MNINLNLFSCFLQMRSLIVCAVLASFLVIVNAHSYHMGACPIVEPLSGFQMSKVKKIKIMSHRLDTTKKNNFNVFIIFLFQFLGSWYVIQKTSTASKCISYNYTRGEEPGEYFIIQDSNHPVLGKQ